MAALALRREEADSVLSRLACFSLRGCDCSLFSAAAVLLVVDTGSPLGAALSLLREACRSLLAAGRSGGSTADMPVLVPAAALSLDTGSLLGAGLSRFRVGAAWLSLVLVLLSFVLAVRRSCVSAAVPLLTAVARSPAAGSLVDCAGFSLLRRVSAVLAARVSRASAGAVVACDACSAVTDVPRGLRLLPAVWLSLALAGGRASLTVSVAAVSMATASPLLAAGCASFGAEAGAFVVTPAVTAGAGFGALCGEGGDGGVAGVGFVAGAAGLAASRGRLVDAALPAAPVWVSVHVPVDPVVRSTGFSESATRGGGEAFCCDRAGGAAVFSAVAGVFSLRLTGALALLSV
jgi:hypothetical protein